MNGKIPKCFWIALSVMIWLYGFAFLILMFLSASFEFEYKGMKMKFFRDSYAVEKILDEMGEELEEITNGNGNGDDHDESEYLAVESSAPDLYPAEPTPVAVGSSPPRIHGIEITKSEPVSKKPAEKEFVEKYKQRIIDARESIERGEMEQRILP